MATLNALTLKDIQSSGNFGALHAHGAHTLAAAAIADKVRLVKLFAGTKIFGVYLVNAALGASTTVSVGFEHENGEAGGGAAALIPATATNAIGRVESLVKPTILKYDTFITATIGGAAATGAIDVVVLFEHQGI